ncbi:MAG: cysteine--tRNA ligase [Actinomycetota bacterium]|nr:cysteine--tRNA ligase [Actinomycetota bacterium]
MKVHNTLGRTLQPLETRSPGAIGMYVCGPTVQSRPHVGHGRAAVAFDVMRRYLEWRGYSVTYVTNITDVEDKIIAASQEEGIPVEVLAERMTGQFLEAYRALGVRDPDVLPKATEHIDEMIELIGRLVELGHAYPSGGDVYFSVRSLPQYGKLSGRRLEELRVGARIEPDEHKRDPLDFALWKASKPGEPSWDSPWGPGRPGWHIECSAMATKYLGFGFEIHGGGDDLIFPHHENEIAQSEAAAAAAPFARYWLHNGMVTMGGEKMAKSTGVLVDLLSALEKYPAPSIRLLYLRTHYRSPLELSEEVLEDAAGALDRLWSFRRRFRESQAAPLPEMLERFRVAMDDDFNTPQAVAVLFEVVREGNRRLDAGEQTGPWVATFDELVGVLGLGPAEDDLSELGEALAELGGELGVVASGPRQVLERLVERREQARREQRWEVADDIRERLAGLGIIIEDTPNGARWHRA